MGKNDRGRKRKPPTMLDVARQANVGLRTVSRYVNGETNIDSDLSGRIASAIEELGYRRNLAAASIRPGQSNKIVGLISSDVSNPFYSIIAEAIEDELFHEGYILTVANSWDQGERHDQILERMLEQRVDGVIIIPTRTWTEKWRIDERFSTPLVYLDRPGPIPNADTVLSDNRAGAIAATQSLVDAGARHVAYLGDSLEIYTMRERYEGIVEVLTAAGIERNLLTYQNAYSRAEAKQAAIDLMTNTAVDAIFAANNRSSIGVLEAYAALKNSLPLIGFDDFEAAHLIGGGISVVAQDARSMGKNAAQLLLSKMQGEERPERTIILPTKLILRGSELPPGPLLQ